MKDPFVFVNAAASYIISCFLGISTIGIPLFAFLDHIFQNDFTSVMLFISFIPFMITAAIGSFACIFLTLYSLKKMIVKRVFPQAIVAVYGIVFSALLIWIGSLFSGGTEQLTYLYEWTFYGLAFTFFSITIVPMK